MKSAPKVTCSIMAARSFSLIILIIVIPLFIFLLSLTKADANTGDITVQWDENPDAHYFVVYYGTSPGDYTQSTDPIYAPELQVTIHNLEMTTWYFSIKAFTECGISSDYSDEISGIPTMTVPFASKSFYSSDDSGSSMGKGCFIDTSTDGTSRQGFGFILALALAGVIFIRQSDRHSAR